MKRYYKGWLLAGLAVLGPSGANTAFGQASAQERHHDRPCHAPERRFRFRLRRHGGAAIREAAPPRSRRAINRR